MDSLMYDLVCQVDLEQAVEMLRELRELSEMSESEREIYGLIEGDDMIGLMPTEAFVQSKEEILSVLN
jgi:hypothetical protein